jgi:GNAT superfamily N-acetyltransferase
MDSRGCAATDPPHYICRLPKGHILLLRPSSHDSDWTGFERRAELDLGPSCFVTVYKAVWKEQQRKLLVADLIAPTGNSAVHGKRPRSAERAEATTPQGPAPMTMSVDPRSVDQRVRGPGAMPAVRFADLCAVASGDGAELEACGATFVSAVGFCLLRYDAVGRGRLGVQWVTIVPKYRNAGIATAMLRYCIEQAAPALGCEMLEAPLAALRETVFVRQGFIRNSGRESDVAAMLYHRAVLAPSAPWALRAHVPLVVLMRYATIVRIDAGDSGRRRTFSKLVASTSNYAFGGLLGISAVMDAAFIVAVEVFARESGELLGCARGHDAGLSVEGAHRTMIGGIAVQSDGWVSYVFCESAYGGGGIGSFLVFIALEWYRGEMQCRHRVDGGTLKIPRLDRDKGSACVNGKRSRKNPNDSVGDILSLKPLTPRLVPLYTRWGFSVIAPPTTRREAPLLGRRVHPRDVYIDPDVVSEFLQDVFSTGERAAAPKGPR